MRVSPSLLLLAALPAGAQSIHRAKAPIAVGPLVQVSKAFPALAHYESLAAGDPDHPGRLITCSTVHPTDGPKAFIIYQYCYTTFDGGKSWEPTLKSELMWGNQDPAAIYGRGDTVFVASLVSLDPDTPDDPDPDKADPTRSRTIVYRSTDGGRTWTESARYQSIDREFLNVDRTTGKYGGRVYSVAQGGIRGIGGAPGPNGLEVMRSIDGGTTFLGPTYAAYPASSTIFGVGTGAVLSNGTYVALFGITKPGRSQNLEVDPSTGPNAELHVFRSVTGGETFTTHKVTDLKLDRSRSEGSILNQLTADPGSKAFKDRLYAVYPTVVDDRVQVGLSYSSDEGKTWSKAIVVNDDRTPAAGGRGPDHILPSVGVNKAGVVLVTWYDRRDAKDDLGWQLRAAASLDGGETFSASVPVTDAVTSFTPATPWQVIGSGSIDKTHSIVSVGINLDPFFTAAGHTTGIAVDADGTFHPTWHSNQTGVMQLWTASIKVDGVALKHGAADLADLDDVSKSVTLQISRTSLDRATGRIALTAQLKNLSSDTVTGPLRVRVLTLESQLGVAEITNADNGEHGTGAVWDFSNAIHGSLVPMQLSDAKSFTFRVSELRTLAAGRELKSSVVRMDTRVYGKLHKAKPADRAVSSKH